jgi:hypothetical protein
VPTTTLDVDLDLVTLGEPPKPASFLAVLVRQFDELEHVSGHALPPCHLNIAAAAVNCNN